MPSEPVLELRGLTKSFASNRALDAVSFSVRPGTVTALLGQNGSGKSTLIKALAGFHPVDAGEVRIGGQPVPMPIDPQAARAHGLRFVHQDIALVDRLSVADNFGLSYGFGSRLVGAIPRKRLRAIARQALDFVGVDVDVDALVGNLPPTERMLVAISRAFEGSTEAAGRHILVLDEPTAALPSASVDRVLEIVERVRAAGGAVIFVTHRIDEVLRVADHVVVLRDGRLVADEPLGTHDSDGLARLIVGAEVEKVAGRPATSAPGATAISVRGLTGPRLRDVSFELRRGEIVGVAGLLGCGRSELARMVAGVQRPDAGELHLDGERFTPSSPRAAIAAGVAFAPQNRREHGCIPEMSLRENVTLGDLSAHRRAGRVDVASERRELDELVGAFDIKPPLGEAPLRTFSGGNQQKAVLAKCVRLAPRVLVVDEPTQGVDIGGKREIAEILRRFAEDGGAVLLGSSDFDEIATACDRVLVLNRGRLIGEYEARELSESRLAVLSTTATQTLEVA